jgi:hypothetical protein
MSKRQTFLEKLSQDDLDKLFNTILNEYIEFQLEDVIDYVEEISSLNKKLLCRLKELEILLIELEVNKR